VFSKFFIPESRLESISREFANFDTQIELGNAEISGENTVDYLAILNWYCKLRDEYNLYFEYIGYDIKFAESFVQDLIDEGFECEPVKQGSNLHSTVVELEGLIKDKKLKICNNNLMKMNLKNVAISKDFNTGALRPVKISDKLRIDGAVALMDAMFIRQAHWDEIKDIITNDD
jgi:phage terminase large subunit-like protein